MVLSTGIVKTNSELHARKMPPLRTYLTHLHFTEWPGCGFSVFNLYRYSWLPSRLRTTKKMFVTTSLSVFALWERCSMGFIIPRTHRLMLSSNFLASDKKMLPVLRILNKRRTRFRSRLSFEHITFISEESSWANSCMYRLSKTIRPFESIKIDSRRAKCGCPAASSTDRILMPSHLTCVRMHSSSNLLRDLKSRGFFGTSNEIFDMLRGFRDGPVLVAT